MTLDNYFGHGYPTGGHAVLASVGWLSGQDLLWLSTPFQAAELGIAALVLAFLAQRAGLTRPAAALAGWIAAVPALVYGYALQGSIKEITLLPLLMGMGALVLLARAHARSGARAALPFALVAAAAMAAIGIAATPWVVLFALAALAFAIPILSLKGLRALGGTAVTLGGAAAVLSLPTIGPLSQTLALARSLQNSNPDAVADPGNLLRPLFVIQGLGVWLGPSHRFGPDHIYETYALIGIVCACAVLGLVWITRRRAYGLLAFVAISVAVWAELTHRGTTWTNAKVLMLLSPVVMVVAMVGALGGVGRRRVEAVLLAATLAVGVLYSDALQFRASGLAPTQRFLELRSIGQRFAGQGPTLATDFDEYALYLLRSMNVSEPGLADRGRVSLNLTDGSVPVYGRSYDIDLINAAGVQRFPMILTRRSPLWSRPPSNYALAWGGRFYDVWRRVGAPPRLHIEIGATGQPTSHLPCTELRQLARRAVRERGRLVYAERPSNVVVDLVAAKHSPKAILIWPGGIPEFLYQGQARVETSIDAPHGGAFEFWLIGAVDQPLHVSIDGHQVAAPRQEAGGDGNAISLGTIHLTRGSHDLQLVREGGGFTPGADAGAAVFGVYLEPLAAEHETVASIAPRDWHSLCGRQLDWIEIV